MQMKLVIVLLGLALLLGSMLVNGQVPQAPAWIWEGTQPYISSSREMGGLFLVGDSDGPHGSFEEPKQVLYGLRTKDGAIGFQFAVDGPVTLEPRSITGDSLLLATIGWAEGDESLLSFNLKTESLTTSSTRSFFNATVIPVPASDHILVAQIGSNRITAYSRLGEEEASDISLDSTVELLSLNDTTSVLALTRTGLWEYDLNKRTLGRLIPWGVDLEPDKVSFIGRTNSVIILIAGDYVNLYDYPSGKKSGQVKLPAPPAGAPSQALLDGDRLLVATSRNGNAQTKGFVAEVNVSDRKIAWSTRIPGGITRGFSATKTYVAGIVDDSEVWVLHRSGGKPVWKHTVTLAEDLQRAPNFALDGDVIAIVTGTRVEGYRIPKVK